MISVEQLTTKSIDGTGVFDILMQAVQVRLDAEFTKGRITGPNYSDVYLGSLTTVIGQSLQYVLSKEQTEAQIALIAAQTAQATKQTELLTVEISKAEAELAILTQRLATGLLEQDQIIAQTSLIGEQKSEVTARIAQLSAETAQMPVKTAQIEAQTDQIIQQTLNVIRQGTQLDKQTLLIQEQTLNEVKNGARITADTDSIVQKTANMVSEKSLLTQQLVTGELQQNKLSEDILNTVQERSNMVQQALQVSAQTSLLGAQLNLTGKQALQVEAETAFTSQRTSNALAEKAQIDKNVLKTQNEIDLLSQKTKTEKAQILDTVDGAEVRGAVGAGIVVQRLQAAGFSRDAEQKAAKLVTDVWAIQKSTNPDATSVNGTGLEDVNIQRIMFQLARGVGVEPLSIPSTGGAATSAGNNQGVLPGYTGSIESGGGSNVT